MIFNPSGKAMKKKRVGGGVEMNLRRKEEGGNNYDSRFDAFCVNLQFYNQNKCSREAVYVSLTT